MKFTWTEYSGQLLLLFILGFVFFTIPMCCCGLL